MIEGNIHQLPRGWVWTTVGDIGEVVTGTTPSKSNSEYYGNSFPFYKPTDLNEGYYVRKSGDGLSEKGIKQSRLLPANSVLVTCIGATIGKTGLIRRAGASNQQINAIVTEKGILPEFIYFICVSPQLQKSIFDNASATTLPILNKSKFEILSVPLPPLPEQNRIVAKIEELFTRLDAGVDALKKIKAQLKRYRQAVLKYAFEGKLTQEWREANKGKIEPASVLLERIKEEQKKKAKGKFKELPSVDTSGFPGLPEGWECARMKEISEKITDGTHFTPTYVDNGIPFISVKDVLGGEIHFDNCRYISDKEHNDLIKRCHPEYQDVLITKSGTIGRTAVVKTNKPFSLFVSVALIKPFKEYVNSNFLSFSLENYINSIDIQQSVKGGVIKNLHIEDLKEIIISLPSLSEQHKIVERIESHLSVADTLKRVAEQSLKQSERLRQSILKRAFEGKLVPQDPTDEPAEKLLERIKEEKAKREGENKREKKHRNKNSKQMELI